MLQAMNTGHDGSLTTVHANNPRDAIGRLEVMVGMANSNMGVRSMRQQISSAIDMFVQVSRFSDGTRRITHITECVGMEGDLITMQDIFVFEKTGLTETGRVTGRFRATGIRPKFYERLRAATRRGVLVTILTPEQNNWRFFANYARLESARSEIDLRLYKDGMSHLKAMLIDDQYLVAGSSNFDYLSYRIHQELLAVLTVPDSIADFRARVMLPDLAKSVAVDSGSSALSQRWLDLQMRMLDAALTMLT